MSAKVPLFPLTRSPLLDEFKRALKRRSKAIKHAVFNWTLERKVDHIDGVDFESLVNSWSTTGPDVTLQVWEDGELWLYASELQGKQVTFELGFHATLGSVTCDALVDLLERTTLPLCIRDSSRLAKDAVLKLWSPLTPFDVDDGRA